MKERKVDFMIKEVEKNYESSREEIEEFSANRDNYVTASEFAELTGSSKQTVINYYKKGSFSGICYNGNYYFEKSRKLEFQALVNPVLKNKLANKTRYIFLCEEVKQQSEFRTLLTDYAEKNGITPVEDIFYKYEEVVNSVPDVGKIKIDFGKLDGIAKAAIKTETDVLSAKYEEMKTNMVNSFDLCVPCLGALMKHIFTNDLVIHPETDTISATMEDVSEYLTSNGVLDFSVDKATDTAKFIKDFILESWSARCDLCYTQDCLKVRYDYRREDNVVDPVKDRDKFGDKYIKLVQEYINTDGFRIYFNNLLHSAFKSGFYDIRFINLGGTNKELSDALYENSLDLQHIVVVGSEHIPEAVQDTMKYYSDGIEDFKLLTTGAFNKIIGA